MLNIGCHLSASNGYTAMAKQAMEIGANTFQFFTRNPRGFKAKDIDEQDVKEFLKTEDEVGIVDYETGEWVYIHTKDGMPAYNLEKVYPLSASIYTFLHTFAYRSAGIIDHTVTEFIALTKLHLNVDRSILRFASDVIDNALALKAVTLLLLRSKLHALDMFLRQDAVKEHLKEVFIPGGAENGLERKIILEVNVLDS